MITKDDLLRSGAQELLAKTGTTVTKLAKLQDGKYRRAYGLFLAEGVKLAEEALRFVSVEMLLVVEEALENTRVEACLRVAMQMTPSPRILIVSDTVFAKVSTEKAPQGIIAVVRRNVQGNPSFMGTGRYLLLDTIQDPGNLGTIARSAAAFGCAGILAYHCADATAPKAVRASMGAIFRCPVWEVEDVTACIRALRESGHRVLVAALRDDNLLAGEDCLTNMDCLVIGNEGHGVSAEVLHDCTAAIRIPMEKDTESLNASTAASILLWEYYRRFGTGGNSQ